MQEKNLQLERLVFFSDAVVAIAITLLALDIKIAHTVSGHLSFADITSQWKTFAAFFLSFINIASFWKNHHAFFVHIHKIDERLLWLNILWLFFIVLLPFSTSLVGLYFSDPIAICIYSVNIFLVSSFQNLIWDYAAYKNRFLKPDSIDTVSVSQTRLYCNLDMINGGIAIVLSLFHPVLAFIFLFTKLPMIVLARIYYRPKGKRPLKHHKKE